LNDHEYQKDQAEHTKDNSEQSHFISPLSEYPSKALDAQGHERGDHDAHDDDRRSFLGVPFAQAVFLLIAFPAHE